ncbi:MAG: hypothetical protein ACKV0T_20225 [Planctomycetales bacterium]
MNAPLSMIALDSSAAMLSQTLAVPVVHPAEVGILDLFDAGLF